MGVLPQSAAATLLGEVCAAIPVGNTREVVSPVYRTTGATLNTDRIFVQWFDPVGDADRHRIITGTIGKVDLLNIARSS